MVPETPILASPTPSFGSDGDSPPAWLRGASSSSTAAKSPPLLSTQPSASIDEEPQWLSEAHSRVSDLHLAVNVMLEGDIDDEESTEQASLLPGANGKTQPVPAFGSPAREAFARAVDQASRAWVELRSLDTMEVSDGLLGLSVGCTRSMWTSLAVGAQESGRFAHDVFMAVASTPEGGTRLQIMKQSVQQRWRGLLQVPAAALFAILALINAVLAMVLTFAKFTPRAVRELAAYCRDRALEYHHSRLPLQEARAPLLGEDEADIEEVIGFNKPTRV